MSNADKKGVCEDIKAIVRNIINPERVKLQEPFMKCG
jgi:hypothetical protein